MLGDGKFGTEDYVVFGVILAISAGIGIYYGFIGGRQQTTKEYLLADKNMSAIPVGFSLMASFMSAITLLGVSAENYIFGIQFVAINISYVFGTIISAYIYLPVFFKLQTTSVYEYLELRFGKITRLAASSAFILQMVLYMAIVLYAPALAFNAVTGFPKWISILSVGFVCTFYSTVGGMKAVLWTDLFQSMLMYAAIFSIIINGALDPGGLSSIWRIAEDGGRIEFFNFDLDPTVRHTFWTQAIGGIFTFTSLHGVNQAQVQRLLSVKNLSTAQSALYLNWPILTVLSLTTSFSGLVIYSKYYNCDPLLTGRINAPDQLLPRYVMDYLAYHPGLAGLFMSGIFCGALSTVSSAVNSLAAVTLEDFVKPCLPHAWLSETKLTFLSKFLALLFGLICLALTYIVEQLGQLLQASFTVFGVVGGPLLGLFSLGMFFYKSNQKGALTGFISGLIICSWIGFGATIEKPYIPKLPQSTVGCPSTVENYTYSTLNTEATITTLFLVNDTTTEISNEFNFEEKNKHILFIYRISYMWIAPIGFFCVIVIGIITSIVTGGKKITNPSLLSPPFAVCYKSVLQEKHEYDSVLGTADDYAQTRSLDSGEHQVSRL